MASITKVVLVVITFNIITTLSMPIDIINNHELNNEHSVQRILDEDFTAQTSVKPHILTPYGTNKFVSSTHHLNNSCLDEEIEDNPYKEGKEGSILRPIEDIQDTLLSEDNSSTGKVHDSAKDLRSGSLNPPMYTQHIVQYATGYPEYNNGDAKIIKKHGTIPHNTKPSFSGQINKVGKPHIHDDCVFEDDNISSGTDHNDDVTSEIFDRDISLEMDHPTPVEDMQAKKKIEDATQKYRISINEILLSRLPFMEENINKRDINEESPSDKHNDDEPNNSEESKDTFNTEKNVNHHADDTAPIFTSEDKSGKPYNAVVSISGVHHSQQVTEATNSHIDQNVPKITAFHHEEKTPSGSDNTEPNDVLEIAEIGSGRRSRTENPEIPKISTISLIRNAKPPITAKTKNHDHMMSSVPIFDGNTKTTDDHDANNVVNDDTILTNIFGEIQNDDITAFQKIESAEEISDELLSQSEKFIKGVIENYPKLSDTNETFNLFNDTNNSNGEGVNDVSDKSNSSNLADIPLHDILVLPIKGDHPESTKGATNNEYLPNKRHEFTGADVIMRTILVPSRIESKEHTNEAVFNTGIKTGTGNQTHFLKEKQLDQNKIQFLSALNINLPSPNVVDIIGNSNPIKKGLQFEEADKSIDEKFSNGDRVIVATELKRETPVENEVDFDKLNMSEEEIEHIGEPPLEIQLAKEELHIQAEDEISVFSHNANSVDRNGRNWSCTPAEMDMFKDSFYHDEIEDSFYLACLENNRFDINSNEVYDGMPIVDRDFISPEINSGTIAEAVVPAYNGEILDQRKSTLSGVVDDREPIKFPVVPVRPAQHSQEQDFLNYFRSLPANLQSLFLRNQNKKSGENIFNRQTPLSWRDVMQILIRPNHPNQVISPEVPNDVRPNQVRPTYPSNESPIGLSRNDSSHNVGGQVLYTRIPNSQSANAFPHVGDIINTNSPLSQRMIPQPLDQVRTVYPGAGSSTTAYAAKPSSTQFPQPGLNQNIRRYPTTANGNQQAQDFDGGIFSKLGTGVLRGVSGLFGAFRNG